MKLIKLISIIILWTSPFQDIMCAEDHHSSPFNDHQQRRATASSQEENYIEDGCCAKCSRSSQNCCYQVMAKTCWNCIISGFQPARERSMELMELKPTDSLLLVGEGAGHDFDVLPREFNRKNLKAFDFSPEMVKQAKVRAESLGIDDDSIFVGDAQALPFTTEKFNKIYFPLSLGSIPNPTLALREAERVLAPGGKIVIFEKLLDDGAELGCCRKFLGFFTRCIFADISRNLTTMMGNSSSLKIVHYESAQGLIKGCWSCLGTHYRLAVLTRTTEFSELQSMIANLS